MQNEYKFESLSNEFKKHIENIQTYLKQYHNICQFHSVGYTKSYVIIRYKYEGECNYDIYDVDRVLSEEFRDTDGKTSYLMASKYESWEFGKIISVRIKYRDYSFPEKLEPIKGNMYAIISGYYVAMNGYFYYRRSTIEAANKLKAEMIKRYGNEGHSYDIIKIDVKKIKGGE